MTTSDSLNKGCMFMKCDHASCTVTALSEEISETSLNYTVGEQRYFQEWDGPKRTKCMELPN